MSLPWNIQQTIRAEVAKQLSPDPCNPCGCSGNCGCGSTTIVRPGDSGKSAYQIALDNGFVGSTQEWLESLGLVDIGQPNSNYVTSFSSTLTN